MERSTAGVGGTCSTVRVGETCTRVGLGGMFYNGMGVGGTFCSGCGTFYSSSGGWWNTFYSGSVGEWNVLQWQWKWVERSTAAVRVGGTVMT